MILPFRLQIILVVFSILCLVFIVNRIINYKIELKYTLLWLLLSISTIILSVFPRSLEFISESLSIETPVNALFMLAIIAIFLIIYSLTISLSRNSTKVKELTQEIGILKNIIENKNKEDSE